jgi:hypothetical protein
MKVAILALRLADWSAVEFGRPKTTSQALYGFY